MTSNYLKGDEIFLIGFSRGAYTARAIAGLIGDVGILTNRGMRYFGDIYADVQNQHDPQYISKTPNRPFRNKPPFRDPAYLAELVRQGMTVPNVPIKALGVWDTVGALGAPRLGWVEKVGLQSPSTRKMSFYDTRLSGCIAHAFQALALDEKRAAFTPALWEKPPGNKTKLRQVWFPGVHSNVGGPGYRDQGLANISLAWMMACLLPYLDLETAMLFEEQALTNAYYKQHAPGVVRPWAMGEIYNSATGLYALAGSEPRTPGAYCVVDPATERETDIPLRATNEFIHPSVRVRTLLQGRGTGDKGVYGSPALRDRTMVLRRTGRDPVSGRDRRTMFWRYEPERADPLDTTEEWLQECPLLPLERQLLAGRGNAFVRDLALEPDRSDEIVDRWIADRERRR